MNLKSKISAGAEVTRLGSDEREGLLTSSPTIPPPATGKAFTLVEVLVVVVLLSLIVLALMAVFNSTQAAFRASITQTDVLEGGRSVMGLIKSDLEEMAPSFGRSNLFVGAVNFCANTNASYVPLVQSLTGGDPNTRRTNVLENFFVLSRRNQTWYGAAYAVAESTDGIYSLYRFATNHPVMTNDPAFLFTNDFHNFLAAITNSSRLLDGVVHLTVRPYDPNGWWMTNTHVFSGTIPCGTNRNVWFATPAGGEAGFCMYSNTLPAAVQIELGVLEDRVLQRAESLPNDVPGLPPNDRRTLYLQGQVGKVHLFRQRIPIRNVDPSAYQ